MSSKNLSKTSPKPLQKPLQNRSKNHSKIDPKTSPKPTSQKSRFAYIYIYMILEQPGLTLEREARSMGDTIMR